MVPYPPVPNPIAGLSVGRVFLGGFEAVSAGKTSKYVAGLLARMRALNLHRLAGRCGIEKRYRFRLRVRGGD